jgi:hypothetical protein
LASLADTKGTPTEGKYLKYTGGFWQPADVAATLGQLTDVDTSGQSAGYVLISNGSTWSASTLPIINGTNTTRTFVGGFAQINLNDSISLTAITADTLKATGDLTIQVDSDNNGANNSLIVKDGANNELFRISEAGVVTINEEYSLPTADGTANQLLKTDGAGALTFGANLQDLDNVANLTPSGNQVLTWSGSEWQPAALPSPPPTVDELNDLTDVTITTPAANQILRYSGSVWENEDLTQYHDRYQSDAATFRSGATATTEIYYSAIADGDGYAESASSDTPATGYDIRRKLYYSEAGFADPDTGTWVQFATIPDDTTFASAKATLLAYLKERTGGTVPISLKMTWEEVAEAPSFTGLLNESYGSGAEAAYSTRRLNGNVTECMVIRRASDSTTTTIGFDGSGNIDESAIETFCTGTTCTVVTWKDQSGNGNDATAAASTNEPTIYTGGALVKENGKVAVDFDGTDDNLQTSSVLISGTTARSIFSVVHADVTNDDDNIISLVNASTGTGSVFNYTIETAVRVAGFKSWTNNPMDAQTLGSVHVAANANVTDIDFYENGTLATSDGESAATIDTSSTGVSTIGKYPAVTGTELDGRIQELVMYASDKSSVRTSIESNIGDYFTQNTPLLDTYTGAAAAYSLRKLRTAYTGNAVTVRRASDNFTQGIGFNVFGELDTVSLAAFCGASDGFVDTWHDQSGNGNDATQGATANQPKIYDSVTGVVTENGKPAVEFDGLSDYIEFGESWGSDMSMFATWKAAATGEQQIYNLEDGGIRFAMSTNRSGDSITTRDNSGAGVGSLSGNPTITALGITSHITNSTSTSHSLHHNNVSLTGTQGSRAQNGTNTFGSASGGTAFYLNGVMSEAVLYLSDKTSDRTNIESNINTFYNIY